MPRVDDGLISDIASFSSRYEPLIDLLTSFIPIAIAVLGGYIAVRQYITSRQKLKLDLFDKRFAIFQASKKFIGQVLTNEYTDKQVQREFLIATQGTRFIFNEKIRLYIDSIWEKSQDLQEWSQNQTSSENSASRADHLKWFNAQLSEIERHFSPYMQLSH